MRSLVRPRLLRRVAEMDPGVALVVGTAGSGKSTLLGQLVDAAGADGVPTARVVAHDDGNLRWHANGDELELTLAAVVDAVTGLSGPWLVTIDDGDRLTDHPDHERDLERLVRLLPPEVQVVIAVAVVPSCLLVNAGRMISGVIGGVDLTFRPYEVDRLFREVHRTPLGAEDVHLLARVTDGWPAALELFHAGTAAHLPAELSRAVRSLVHEPWFLAGYAEQVLLTGCSTQELALLRWGSVFEHLTPARLDALLGAGDHAATLDRLERRPSLPAARTSAGLRLPGPLRRYLRATHARDLGRAGAREWFLAGGAVLEADGDVPGALLCYGRGGDAVSVRRLTERPDAALWHGARAAEPWDEALPDDATPHARLFARLSRAMADGALTTAGSLIEQLDAGADPRLARLRGSLVAWGSARTITAQPDGDVEWRTRLRWALQGAPSPTSSGRPADLFVAGLVHGLSQDADLARDELGRVVEDPGAGRGLGLLASLAALLLDRTLPLQQLLEGADRILVEAHELGLAWTERLAQTVVLAVDGTPGWREAVGRLRRWGQEASDAWGPLVVSSVAELCAMRRDEDDSQRWLELAAAWHERGLPLVAETCRVAAARTTAWRLVAELPPEDWAGTEAPAVPRVVEHGGGGASDVRERRPVAGRGRVTEIAAGASARVPSALVSPTPTAPTGAPTAGALAARPVAETGVRLRCLGPFELRADGRVVDLTRLRPRARNLLRLLAIEAGHVVHRERLVEALWFDLSPESATHNLHVAVSAVRRLLNEVEPGLGRRLLQREGESYVLRLGEGASCDLLELEAALRSGEYAASRDDDELARRAWSRALAAYPGELLPEAGSAEWVLGPRDRLRQQVAGAATSLAALLLRAGEPVAAAEAASRAIELDEWRDNAWRVLIAALTLSGERASAQRVRRSYREVLRSLGIDERDPSAVRTGGGIVAGRDGAAELAPAPERGARPAGARPAGP
ncbi:DNA-binding SARP family transcriptional activator [Salana multivorans]|uniref:DNA-binding SARP family transcriptional activator n=1 Tax=Salana multivorans TaxID=120377 RepID=A0A3N2DCT3_9MICO|nr:BTAD domain-containing putative transcriptional regulator [Salana multivorans]ROR97599.1 DNA-binding SARP family transcriptional activator [Salana multivorans]